MGLTDSIWGGGGGGTIEVVKGDGSKESRVCTTQNIGVVKQSPCQSNNTDFHLYSMVGHHSKKIPTND